MPVFVIAGLWGSTAISGSCLFENLSDLNKAVPKHLADESETRSPDTPPENAPDHPEGGPVVYPANAFDSRLQGDQLQVGVEVRQNLKNRLFGLAASNCLSLTLSLSFSSLPYFLSFSVQRRNLPLLVAQLCDASIPCCWAIK